MKKILIISWLFLQLLVVTYAAEPINTIDSGASLIFGFWQHVLSPQDGPRCNFYPTCSEYARQAIKKNGAIKGSIMASERLQRCTCCHNLANYTITKEGRIYDSVENNLY